MTTIELIYFDGCPSWEHAWNDLGEILAATRVESAVQLRNIEDVPDVQRRGFGGSPTLRIDGRDLEGYDGPPVYACRRYLDNQGRGWPDRQHLVNALEASATADSSTGH